ncbi:MAG: DUF2283 domain-containing protein [Candidatus Sumerlaeota bacterium]|nr:DUF2283 domain-containing protein [Candidatus Sumerlaeota bacterium]
MNKPQMKYFEEEDVLHLIISEGREAGSIEITPNLTVELNSKGEIIGLEILQASRFLCDSVLESAQAKIANIKKPAAAGVGPTRRTAARTRG